MNYCYEDLVSDVVNRMKTDYQEYLDDLGDYIDERMTPSEFAEDDALFNVIDDVLIPTSAVWCVIETFCVNPTQVFNGEAPDYDGESAYIQFYDDCMKEFIEEVD